MVRKAQQLTAAVSIVVTRFSAQNMESFEVRRSLAVSACQGIFIPAEITIQLKKRLNDPRF